MIDIINFVDSFGYDVIPVKIGGKFKVHIYLNNVFNIEGSLFFDDYDSCLFESYKKLNKKLGG